MSDLYRRNSTVLKANSSDATDPDFAANYDVTVYEVGAVVNGVQAGVSTVTVRTGHGFAANDYAMVGTDETKFFKVGSVTTTTLVLDSGTVTVADGDFINNLGLDTGTTSPNYDGSQINIYDEPSGTGTPISNSRIICDSEGGYGYWHDVPQVWELVRSTSAVPVEVVPDTVKGVTGPASATDNALARFDGTSGRMVQDSGVTVDDSGNMSVATTAGITASTTQSQGQQALAATINEVSTVANANDVVTLPLVAAGRTCVVINNGANTLQIFPASADDLGQGVNTSTSIFAGEVATFYAYDATNWRK